MSDLFGSDFLPYRAEVRGAPGLSVQFSATVLDVEDRGWEMVVCLYVPERTTGHPVRIPFRMNVDPTDPDRSGLLRSAVLAALAHELDEGLKRNSVRVRDPHAEDFR